MALPLPTIESRFKGRGPWKKSLPRILETLRVLGRARREGDGWRGESGFADFNENEKPEQQKGVEP